MSTAGRAGEADVGPVAADQVGDVEVVVFRGCGLGDGVGEGCK